MCPAGIATSHPTGELLSEWSKLGCPTKTGRPWSKEEMWEAVARGPHQSSRSTEALAHFTAESAEKVKVGQARLVLWDNIKDDPPPQLKISPQPWHPVRIIRIGDSKVAARVYHPTRRLGTPLTVQPSPKMTSASGLLPS